MDIEIVRNKYKHRYDNYLKTVEPLLKKWLCETLAGIPRIDRISVRAKSVDRFVAKSQKLDDKKKLKYKYPLNQIQDQIGARIVTYYLDDVKVIGEYLEGYLRHIEKQSIVPDSIKEFGYEGQHYIFFLPETIIPDSDFKDNLPPFFELQIKTLFQHAWGEAEHDIGYKPNLALTPDDKRKIAFTSAQAWGADRIFNELFLKQNKMNS